MNKNKYLDLFKKHYKEIIIIPVLVIFIILVIFINYFFNPDVKNQEGKILLDKQGEEISTKELLIYQSDDRILKINTAEDGSVYGTYQVNGLIKNFKGRYSADGKMLYTTMEYLNEYGDMLSEEFIFKIKENSIALGIGEKFVGKGGIKIYEDVEKIDFSSVILYKK